jgi:WD40 repeat protein
VALGADGKVLLAGCEEGFVVWDLEGSDRWVVRAGNILSVTISPSGRLFAACGRQLELWSLASKRLVASWLPPQTGARVEFSANGRVLLAVVNGVPAAGWPVSDTPERRLLVGHTQGVPAVAFRPDGRQLVSVSKDRAVQVWNPATGRLLRTLTGHPGEIEAVAYSPDGTLLATGDRSGRILVWDAHSGKLLAEDGHGEIPGEVWQLRFGPGGEYLAAAGSHMGVWTVRATGGKVVLERLLTLATLPGKPEMIDLAVMPGGAELVHLNRGGRLYSYDLSRTDEARLVGSARTVVRALHFTPSGDRLTCITPGGTLGVWDWRSKKLTDTHRRAELVAVSPDGRWAAIGEAARKVTIIELATGREVLALPPEGSDVWCLAWAPDGRKLAVGLSDGAMAVWNLEQVRARLAEFGLDLPSMARVEGIKAPAPVPAFEHIIHVNRLRVEAERARKLAAHAREAGHYPEERDHLLTARNRDAELARIVPDVAGHRRRLAGMHAGLARSGARLGDNEGIRRHLEALAKLLKELEREEPKNAEYRRLLVVAHHNVAFEFANTGCTAAARRWYRSTLALHDQMTADFPTSAGDPKFCLDRAKTLLNLGIIIIHARAGETGAAVKLLRESVAIQGRVADQFPANADHASLLGRTLMWLGWNLGKQGEFDEAVRVCREAIRRQRAALALRPADTVMSELCANHESCLNLVLRWKVQQTILKHLMNAAPFVSGRNLRLVQLAPQSFILLPLIMEQNHVPTLVASMGTFAVSLLRAHPVRRAPPAGSGTAGGPHGPQSRGPGGVGPAGVAPGGGDGAFRGHDRAAGRRDG